jgi:peroxiredoxin family protein
MAENDRTLQDLLKRVEALEKRMPEDRLTLGVMSGTMDYTMAAFIVALAAAASGMEVDMFFTFWATASLRDPGKSSDKDAMGKMFGMMLPDGAGNLPLSRMQMLGVGPRMIKHIMKKHGAQSLEELMEHAAEFGIRIHVCTMSMDLMGIKKEELIDYPEMDFVGAAAFVNMFDKSRQCWFM